MGYIKELVGIDFEINGKPLTDQQKITLTAFIKADKVQRALQASSRKKQAESKSPIKPHSV
ncbi:hypothetical protein [Spirosoma linguale]|uniref:Uncharacterized protein n=1 Tax=Spirosoma linguale (strain ATCC 33905 / DSM 74 / LMG 10896 / Claus 1) TaxID=504472 RepID=D2QPK5_SPILD|nr:hypothetical protein Slin_4686 [Spirosoma linguale DSM 74]